MGGCSGASLADQITLTADSFLLGALVSVPAAGVYGAVYRLPNAATTILGLVTGVLIARMAAVLREDPDRGPVELRRALRVSAIGGIALVALAPVARALVVPVFGAEYQSGETAAAVLFLALAVVCAGAPLHAAALAARQDRAYVGGLAGAALVNVAANLVLIPPLELSGAAFATLTSSVLLFGYLVVIVRRALWLPVPPPTHGRGRMTAAVSVVVLSWNDGELLDHALSSIPGSRRSVELIVVDNGSAPPVEVSGVDIRLVRLEENRGVAAGRNVGVRASTAPVVCFLDSDAVLLPGSLDRLVDVLDERPDVALVAPTFVDQTPEASAGAAPGLVRKVERALGRTESYAPGRQVDAAGRGRSTSPSAPVRSSDASRMTTSAGWTSPTSTARRTPTSACASAWRVGTFCRCRMPRSCTRRGGAIAASSPGAGCATRGRSPDSWPVIAASSERSLVPAPDELLLEPDVDVVCVAYGSVDGLREALAGRAGTGLGRADRGRPWR